MNAVQEPLAAPRPVLEAAPWVVLLVGFGIAALWPGQPDVGPARAVVMATFTATFLLLAARAVRGAVRDIRRRTGLALLATGVVLWGLGSAWVSAELAVGPVTFPAHGEILCLAAYLFLAAHLLVDVPRRVATASVVWLEAGIVWLATVCLAAFAVLVPLSAQYPHGGLTLLLAVVFPLINVMLAAVVAGQVILRQRERSSRTAALVVGFLGLAVADSGFVLRLSTDSAYTTDLGTSLLWGASFAAVVAGSGHRSHRMLLHPHESANPVIITVAATLAVSVLVVNPSGPAGWWSKVPAVLTLVLAGARLILALREAQRSAEALQLSLTDELTGLGNRRSVVAYADRASADGTPLGVLVVDLAGFKDVNDSLGHAVGDEVLVSTGQRIRTAVGSRTQVARIGADEFAVVLTTSDPLELLEVAQQVKAAVREPLQVEGMDLRLDSAVGASLLAGGTGVEVLRRADIAMHEAKASGYGLMLFDPTLDGVSRDRLRRGEEIRHAIARREIAVWYQPQVDARTRRVVGVEALVRWQHPEQGMVSPAVFLADARRAGLMPALTRRVVDLVLADATRWHREGYAFQVAMNWAPPELMHADLLGHLYTGLAAADLPEDRIVVEVTEDCFMAEPERTRVILGELRRHGVEISVDDYGTGFSSLAYLRDLPVQELKIDRTFVARVVEDPRSRMIVQTTVQLGRALGMRLVAEGVEDARTAADLLPLGIDVLQGYHVARPMSGESVAPWVRQWTRSNVDVHRAPAEDTGL